MRFILAFLLLILPLAARAANETAELKKVERAQRAKEAESKKLAATSAKLQTEVAGLKTKLVAVSTRLSEHEEKLEGLEAELVNIQQQESKLSAERNANQKDLSEVLAIVLRLSRLPPEAMVFMPTPPQQTIYTTLGMQTVMAELNRRVALARQQLGDLAAVREKLRAQQEAISAQKDKITADQAELDGLLKKREGVRKQTEAQRAAADQEAKTLAARASDLRELIQQLRARKGKHKTPPANMALVAAGSARLPVAGAVTRAYGSEDSAGNHARGITIFTPARAVVNAPRGGQIVFAGAFRSYGQVVIIEIAEGQHILLTGLGSINVSEGENVSAGEPVGHMPDEASALYLETRKDGEPVDPNAFGLTQSTKIQIRRTAT